MGWTLHLHFHLKNSMATLVTCLSIFMLHLLQTTWKAKHTWRLLPTFFLIWSSSRGCQKTSMLFTTQTRGSDEYRTPSLNQPFLLLVPTYCRSWTALFASLSLPMYGKSHLCWRLARSQCHSLWMTPGPWHCYVFYRRFLSGSFINRYRVIGRWCASENMWLCYYYLTSARHLTLYATSNYLKNYGN